MIRIDYDTLAQWSWVGHRDDTKYEESAKLFGATPAEIRRALRLLFVELQEKEGLSPTNIDEVSQLSRESRYEWWMRMGIQERFNAILEKCRMRTTAGGGKTQLNSQPCTDPWHDHDQTGGCAWHEGLEPVSDTHT